jgi:hypothetical protein
MRMPLLGYSLGCRQLNWPRWFCWLLILPLLSCTPPAAKSPVPQQTTSERPLVQHLYIWQRQWTTHHPLALSQSQADFSQLRVLALQYHVSPQGPVWFETQLPLPLLKQDGRPLWLVIRLDGQLPQLPQAALQQRLAKLLQQWQQAGLRPAVIEIDYDSARSQLPAYQRWLQQRRAQIPSDIQLAITALPDWLQSPDFPALLQQVDILTLQLHSVLSPVQGLFDPVRARNWASQLAVLSHKPFYLALPAYHSALVRLPTSASGSSATAATWLVESEVPQLYAGERQELWLDPIALQQLQAWLQQQPWPQLQGLVWFRLPLPTDQRSLPLSTLQAIVRQQPLQQQLQLSLTGKAPVWELWALNQGQTPELLPRQLKLDGSACLQTEAMAGASLERDSNLESSAKLAHNNQAYQLQLPNRRLGPGQRQLLAWFHCQQLKLQDTAPNAGVAATD